MNEAIEIKTEMDALRQRCVWAEKNWQQADKSERATFEISARLLRERDALEQELVVFRSDRENLHRRVQELRGALADAWQRFRGAGDITGAKRIEVVMPDLKPAWDDSRDGVF